MCLISYVRWLIGHIDGFNIFRLFRFFRLFRNLILFISF